MTGAGTLQTALALRPYQLEALEAIRARAAAGLRSSEAGQGVRRQALARLAGENRAVQEELCRLRRVLAGDREAEAPGPGAPGRQQAEP